MNPMIVYILFAAFMLYILLGGLSAYKRNGMLKSLSGFVKKIKEDLDDE